MKALVSSSEQALSYNGEVLGLRIVEVRETEFPVAPQLFWVDCPIDCMADVWYYSDGECLKKPEPPPPPPEE